MEEELTKTERAQKYARSKAVKAARIEREVSDALFRAKELAKKNKLNSEPTTMTDGAAALRKKRIGELVADTKKQNYYRWVAELHKQKKHKEKNNGRIS